MRFWYALDTAAHWLKLRHLMPRRLGAWICDRFDLSLGMTRDEIEHNKFGDFYENDEPAEVIRAAFESGEKGVTQRPNRTFRCEHQSITGPFVGTPTTTLCRCEMEEVTA